MEKTNQAIGGAVDALGHQLGDGADLAFVFVTKHHADGLRAISAQLREKLGCSAVIGTTMSGVVGQGRSIDGGPGISVLAARLPDAGLHLFDFEHLAALKGGQDPMPQGGTDDEELCQAVCGTPRVSEADRPKLLVLLTDLFSTPAESVVRRLNDCFPTTPLVGGRVVSGRRPGSTRLLVNDNILSKGAVGLSICGQLASHAVRADGVRSVSEPVVVTKASRMVVWELGGRPAYQWLRDWYEGLNPRDQASVRAGRLLSGRLIEEHRGGADPADFAIRSLGQIQHERDFIAVQDPRLHTGQTLRLFLPDGDVARKRLNERLAPASTVDTGGFTLAFSDWRRRRTLLGHEELDARSVSAWAKGQAVAGGFVHGEFGPVAGRYAVSTHGLVAASAATSGPG